MNEEPPEDAHPIVKKWWHVLNATEPLSGWPTVYLIESQETPYQIPE
jgi:hypothetical protein